MKSEHEGPTKLIPDADIKGYIRRGLVPACSVIAFATVLSYTLPGDRSFPLRLCCYFMAFLIARDAMTPLHLWAIGTTGKHGKPFFWLRLPLSGPLLCLLSVTSLIVIGIMNRLEPELAEQLVLFRGNWFVGCTVGLAAAHLANCPMVVVNAWYEDEPPYLVQQMTKTTTAMSLWNKPLQRIGLGSMCFFGNLYEEVLYRGYLVVVLTTTGQVSQLSAAVISGFAFAISHMYLAYILTDAYEGILVFTLWEGLLAGVVQMWFGLIPATITHGLCIYFMCIQLGREMPYATKLFWFVAAVWITVMAVAGHMPLKGMLDVPAAVA